MRKQLEEDRKQTEVQFKSQYRSAQNQLRELEAKVKKDAEISDIQIQAKHLELQKQLQAADQNILEAKQTASDHVKRLEERANADAKKIVAEAEEKASNIINDAKSKMEKEYKEKAKLLADNDSEYRSRVKTLEAKEKTLRSMRII